ncbi:MAG: acyclic terpene utilization AtuA family protein [Sporomusaceae bacterium]|nr:acyclic terpene utilization AtuA family protein [Sporomusaceae bacterium]
MKKIRIGSGAGYAGDRIEPAVEVAQKGNIQYLIFECLAERTIALAQKAKLADPNAGYDALLADRMHAVLAICKEKGIKIITNMGAANPAAGAKKIKEIAQELGLKDLKIAAVLGDDVLEHVLAHDYEILETGQPLATIKDKIVSANAYLGCAPMVAALREGADVIITGRVADPALFLAPLVYEFNWSLDNWDLLGKGTVLGHLMECAGQVTGGYFADPGYKDVADLARLGFPIAEAAEDGSFIITKVAEAGGRVTPATCQEQLIYEIHDPKTYLTPDVVADFSAVSFKEQRPDAVSVSGATGRSRTDSFKVSVGYRDSYIGEGQISYAGPGAAERAQLALEIVKERLILTGVSYDEIKFDLIGMNSLHGEALSTGSYSPYEVRLRVAARTKTLKEATRIGNEVESLYTNGPAGGGGATKSAKEVVAVLSVLLPRDLVKATLHYEVI